MKLLWEFGPLSKMYVKVSKRRIVLASAQKEATQTIKDFEMLTLCHEAREVFANALLNPPAPNETLRKGAGRYKKHVIKSM